MEMKMRKKRKKLKKMNKEISFQKNKLKVRIFLFFYKLLLTFKSYIYH